VIDKTLKNLEPVNVMACFALVHICTVVTWIAKAGGWSGAIS
jgi:hypothetical protein